ncbi:cyclic AMP-dependent transcription factor ATF-4 [Osmerus eperlanus]|uniref:cyclic AMP-dependent transcription factor ATF-4 n=1 Tax=Osmerus eperlanus TaxID=29151 RepID=UPI002E1250D4
MSLSSQLALEDVGGLLLGPSFLTADPMGPLLDQDEEEALSPSSSLSSQGRAPPSPPLSFSSYASSPFSSSTPPPSPPPPFHPSLLESKAGADVLSLPWLGEGDLLDAHVGLDGGKEDAFSGMDWMTEKIDLSDFDLESLMGSCSPGNPPSSPEELLASLESHLDLEPFAALPAQPGVLDLGLPLAHLPPVPLDLPLPEEEMEMEGEEEPVLEVEEWKSEPRSPAPLSPALSPAPLSPAFTLELGSEVDVLEVDKITTTIIPEAGLQTVATPILLSLSPSATFMVVLTPKDEPVLLHTSPPPSSSSPSSDSESDSGIDSSVSGSPARRSSSPPPPPSSSAGGSCRTKPYSKPSPSSVSPKVKSSGGGGGPPKVVEKKLKKMEQNKTAATRYRQKKRVEQDVLNTELCGLESRNRELAEKAESISREIQYLKDLMEEVRSAKTRRAAPKPPAEP